VSENHTVVTEDGYILGIFRIINPYLRLKPIFRPILLWHGIDLNSDCWLYANPGQINKNGIYSERLGTILNNCKNHLTSNLAFTLSACGWDVWLGNTRGTGYSNKHISYLIKSILNL